MSINSVLGNHDGGQNKFNKRIATKLFMKHLKKQAKKCEPTRVKWSDCQKMTPEQFNSLFKD